MNQTLLSLAQLSPHLFPCQSSGQGGQLSGYQDINSWPKLAPQGWVYCVQVLQCLGLLDMCGKISCGLMKTLLSYEDDYLDTHHPCTAGFMTSEFVKLVLKSTLTFSINLMRGGGGFTILPYHLLNNPHLLLFSPQSLHNVKNILFHGDLKKHLCINIKSAQICTQASS